MGLTWFAVARAAVWAFVVLAWDAARQWWRG